MSTGETPERAEEERDGSPERRKQGDAQRYRAHEDPERVDPDEER